MYHFRPRISTHKIHRSSIGFSPQFSTNTGITTGTSSSSKYESISSKEHHHVPGPEQIRGPLIEEKLKEWEKTNANHPNLTIAPLRPSIASSSGSTPETNELHQSQTTSSDSTKSKKSTK